jgi:hypothetical protein
LRARDHLYYRSNGIYAGLFASGFLLDRYMGHYKRRDGFVRIENRTFIVGATVSELVLLVFPRRLDRLERAPGWHH